MKRFLALCTLVAYVFIMLPFNITAAEADGCCKELIAMPVSVPTVLASENKTVSEIEVENFPKFVYLVGDSLDLNGASIRVRYSDGSTESLPITEDMVSGFSSNESATLSLTVTYRGVFTSYDVEIHENSVLSIKLISDFSKKEYLEGERFDVSGAKIAVNYENGTYEEIAVTDSMVFGFRPNVSGNQNVSVVFGGTEISVPVTVVPKSVVNVSIDSVPYKKIYAVGESLDLSGGTLSVSYNNNTNVKIPIQPLMISGFDTTSQGECLLIVNYEGKTATFTVSVVSVLRGDLNFDGVVDRSDAVYLLYHLFLPNEYRVNQSVDFNLDGIVSDRDVRAVLRGEIKEEGGSGEPGGSTGGSTGGNGGLIDGPGVGTEVPPVGDFPFQSPAVSRRSAAGVSFQLSEEAIYTGKTANLRITSDGSVPFSSAFVRVECEGDIEACEATWLENGILSDIAENKTKAVLLKENASVSDDLFSLTLLGARVSQENRIRITVSLCNEEGLTVAEGSAEFVLSVLEVPFRYGDVNADALIDETDFTILLRYLNGWDLEIQRPAAMDVNADGVVNSLDGLLLKRYVEGWDVKLAE